MIQYPTPAKVAPPALTPQQLKKLQRTFKMTDEQRALLIRALNKIV